MVTAHYKKDDLLYWWNICSEISGYHAEISRRTRHCRSRAGGAAWHVWINGTTWQGSSIGTAWARHAMCEPAFSITKSLQESASTDRVQSSSSARCRHYQLWNRADCKLYIFAPCIVIHICEKVEQDEHFLLTIYLLKLSSTCLEKVFVCHQEEFCTSSLSSKGPNYHPRNFIHLCWWNWRTFWRKNAAERSPRGSCSCTTLPRLTEHLQPKRNWPTWASNVLITHPILRIWTLQTTTCSLDWKNNWNFATFRPTGRSLLPRRPGWTDKLMNFFEWLAKLRATG